MMSFNFKYFMFSFGFIVMSHVRMSTFFTQANTITNKIPDIVSFSGPRNRFLSTNNSTTISCGYFMEYISYYFFYKFIKLYSRCYYHHLRNLLNSVYVCT